ncbi:death-associated inhibitor of apoptosis 1 isoform X2 [Orussus abietinus]|nr:death-associated inhibitor of apoptosis 1 isoform X2 [Orussus abietinus]XP_012276928.1 death-associated inhibitor of apoptosis 1 isoform X2 [Orussus abietinus]XP_012276929.1 death-associated inhibitor of apoptosis 1 isoform X2 [Orussus abietinus]
MTGIVEHRDLRDSLSPFKSADHPHIPPPTLPLLTHVDEVDNIDYRFEDARLESFRNWPIPFMDPAKLAAAGFYYTGEGDKVRCFECQVEICQWIEGDNPMVDHQRWSGRCRFIRKQPCGNVPIGVDPQTVPPPLPRSRDVCGPYGVEYRPTSGPDNHSFTKDLQLPSNAKLGCLGLGRPKGPCHPEYASYDARLRTFESWPKSMPQTKEQLADAGFFYTGKGDQTLCYHCGGGLKDWEPEDDPWEQHAKWFSKCYYLLLVKGQEFVSGVTGQRVSPPSKEEAMQMNLPSYIKKVEHSAAVETETKPNVESNPGPSTVLSRSQDSGIGSQDSGIENLGSSKNSSLEDLSNVKPTNSKPIDDARICKICYNEELGVVFLPCGHMVACVKCAPGMTTCAVCREPVSMTVRAFFS